MSEEEYEELREIHPELADVMRQASESQVNRLRDSFIKELREIEDKFFTERGDCGGDAEAWIITVDEQSVVIDHDAGTSVGQLVFSEVNGAPEDVYALLKSNDLFLSLLGKEVVGLLVRVGGKAKGKNMDTGDAIKGQDVVLTMMVNGSGFFTACRMLDSNEVHTESVMNDEVDLDAKDDDKGITGRGRLADTAFVAFNAPKQIRLTQPQIADAMEQILNSRKDN